MTEFACQWQYEWNPRTWVDFPPEQNEATEYAFQQGAERAQVPGDGHGRDGIVNIQLDFINMIQMGKIPRKIRRVAVLKAAECPPLSSKHSKTGLRCL